MRQPSTHSPTDERSAPAISGWPLVVAGLFFLAAAIGKVAREPEASPAITAVLVLTGVLVLVGLYTVQPNQGVVTSAFGSYTGTDRGVGLRWLPFWMGRSKISLRVRNMTSETLKVNDRRGNPVEIAANIVWRVEQPAQSVYDVEDYLVARWPGSTPTTAMRKGSYPSRTIPRRWVPSSRKTSRPGSGSPA